MVCGGVFSTARPEICLRRCEPRQEDDSFRAPAKGPMRFAALEKATGLSSRPWSISSRLSSDALTSGRGPRVRHGSQAIEMRLSLTGAISGSVADRPVNFTKVKWGAPGSTAPVSDTAWIGIVCSRWEVHVSIVPSWLTSPHGTRRRSTRGCPGARLLGPQRSARKREYDLFHDAVEPASVPWRRGASTRSSGTRFGPDRGPPSRGPEGRDSGWPSSFASVASAYKTNAAVYSGHAVVVRIADRLAWNRQFVDSTSRSSLRHCQEVDRGAASPSTRPSLVESVLRRNQVELDPVRFWSSIVFRRRRQGSRRMVLGVRRFRIDEASAGSSGSLLEEPFGFIEGPPRSRRDSRGTPRSRLVQSRTTAPSG